MRQADVRLEDMARFFRRVKNVGGDGCWEWIGAQQPGGYGNFWLHADGKRRYITAHRHFYELICGPLPSDVFVCHTCDNPACVRPDHLFAGTPLDNTQDMIAKGRKVDPWRGRTLCIRGHPLMRLKSGKRGCRLCISARGRAWRIGCTMQEAVDWHEKRLDANQERINQERIA